MAAHGRHARLLLGLVRIVVSVALRLVLLLELLVHVAGHGVDHRVRSKLLLHLHRLGRRDLQHIPVPRVVQLIQSQVHVVLTDALAFEQRLPSEEITTHFLHLLQHKLLLLEEERRNLARCHRLSHAKLLLQLLTLLLASGQGVDTFLAHIGK